MHTVTGNVSVFVEIVSAHAVRMNVAAGVLAVKRVTFDPAVYDGCGSGNVDFAGHDACRLQIAHFSKQNASFDVVDPASFRILRRGADGLSPRVFLMRVAAVRGRVIWGEEIGLFSGERGVQL